MNRGRVIGVGQPAAGDDGVGIAIINHLRERGRAGDFELHEAHDGVSLVELLEDGGRALIVDAALGAGAPGTIHELSVDALGSLTLAPLSTHDLSVAAAIALSLALGPERAASSIRIIAVATTASRCLGPSLSPEVAAAIPVAAEIIERLVASARWNGT